MPNDPRSDALRAVFSKAATDADFRARCLTDGPAAVKEVSGLEVTGITFTETKGGEGVFLPNFGSDPDEISDLEALDGVAGGMFYVEFTTGC